jgi:hypothetical protein
LHSTEKIKDRIKFLGMATRMFGAQKTMDGFDTAKVTEITASMIKVVKENGCGILLRAIPPEME